MEPNETMVEEFGDMTADDALGNLVAEDTGEPEESLSSFMDEEAPAEGSKENQSQGTSEPGWIKKRVSKEVQKAVAQTEARMRSEFEKQMAPLREQLLNTEAQALVNKGTVKDLETAKELVRYRQGMGAPTSTDNGGDGRPRNEKGQFTSTTKGDPATSARIEMLQHQADKIRGNKGPDVIAEFNNNDEIKQKVISGEMDFYDVAEYMRSKASRSRSPSPVRSPNGTEYSNGAIMSMSDDMFDKFVEKVKGGTRFRER